MNELSQTALILERISQGEQGALNELVAHTYPVLLRWAHGRIPKTQQNLYETSDLVQETLMKGIAKTGDFKAMRTGAFLAYLRTIFINHVTDYLRKKQINTDSGQLATERVAQTAGDVDDFLAYEQALSKLSAEEQQAVVLRLEFGMTHAETAEAMGKSSEDAARMFTNRALLKLAGLLKS
jgi:RNA polymerase sigma factor (sigma-70 family)